MSLDEAVTTNYGRYLELLRDEVETKTHADGLIYDGTVCWECATVQLQITFS
jgi:hypothetical protein